MVLGQMVGAPQGGFLNEEVIHEELPSGVDRDDLWRRLQVGRLYRLCAERLLPRRPRGRQPDAVVEHFSTSFSQGRGAGQTDAGHRSGGPQPGQVPHGMGPPGLRRAHCGVRVAQACPSRGRLTSGSRASGPMRRRLGSATLSAAKHLCLAWTQPGRGQRPRQDSSRRPIARAGAPPTAARDPRLGLKFLLAPRRGESCRSVGGCTRGEEPGGSRRKA